MSLDKTFCPSPWFHMRINNSGTYEYCRWMSKPNASTIDFHKNIKNQDPLDYFQNTMAPIRQALLDGKTLPGCNDCVVMEQHNKVSGRQKQLLKVGIMDPWFSKTMASSTFRPAFDYSHTHIGHTDRGVLDWQIDLGNYCNGSCMFCNPSYSSKLATEFKKIGLIDQLPINSWCDDPKSLARFIDNLVNSPGLQYLHFIGGETLITPAFKKILTALVEHKLADKLVVGFTTNLNAWDDSVVELLKEFKQINLGLSIESLTLANDYVRWPSKQDYTKKLLDQWVSMGQEKDWLLQLRNTPTCLTIQDLDTVYEYAWINGLCVESCNFLDNPEFMRIDVLPATYKEKAKQKLQDWVDRRSIDHNSQKIINIRNPNVAREQLVQDAKSYIEYINQSADESHRLPDLVDYIKKLESSRKNNILDYIPEYEQLLKSSGY